MVHRIVKPFTLFFILSALLASSCLAEIHWTYHPSVHGIDGPSAPYVTSPLGTVELRYVLPAKWTLSDTRFFPPGKLEADAYVVAVPIQAPAPWTPDRAKELVAAVLSQSVPRGATGATVVSEGLLPVRIDGQSAYEICFSYSFYAQAFTGCVVYVEHGKIQLQFHLVAQRKDYPDLHGAFVGSLLSLDGF
jgi:hypothetical protein